MTATNRTIVEKALAARTVDDAAAVQQIIAEAIGARHQRPLGDTWNNQGILTGSGSSYDHKALEVVTNMQDAVLELHAIQTYGSRSKAPFSTRTPPPQSCSPGSTRSSSGSRHSHDRQGGGHHEQEAHHHRDARSRMRYHRQRGCSRDLSGRGEAQGRGRLAAGHVRPRGRHHIPNAAVVLVSRRHPDLLESGQTDKITIAVVQWERSALRPTPTIS